VVALASSSTWTVGSTNVSWAPSCGGWVACAGCSARGTSAGGVVSWASAPLAARAEASPTAFCPKGHSAPRTPPAIPFVERMPVLLALVEDMLMPLYPF